MSLSTSDHTQLAFTRQPESPRSKHVSRSSEESGRGRLVNQTSLNNLATWVLYALLILLPVLVIPFTNNFIIHSKIFTILFGAIIISMLYFADSFKKRVWRVVVSPITVPLVLYGLAIVASTFLTQNYPVENLLGLGGVLLASVVIALLGPSLANNLRASLVIPLFVGAVCIVNAASLLQFFEIGPTHLLSAITGFEFEHTLLFNLSGSSLIAAQLGVLALVGMVAKIVIEKKVSFFDTLALPFLLFSLGLHIWSMLPNQPANIVLPPFSTSWSVAIDSLKIPRAAIIGNGAESYANTYSRYMPSWMNIDRYWQVQFGSASGLPLSFLVQFGFLGLVAWIFFATKFTLTAIKDQKLKHTPLTWMLLSSLLMQLFFPLNYVLFGIQAVFLAIWTATHIEKFSIVKIKTLGVSLEQGLANKASSPSNYSIQQSRADKFASLLVNSFFLVSLMAIAAYTTRAYASYHHLYLAEKAMMNEDGASAYEHQQQAIALNPYLDVTRRIYALTNIQIAIALSNKADVSEQEKQTINSLVQQAVREAQAATTINPQNFQNWLALAQIYQELIGSVEEADQWAVNAYVNAIQTSPSNPILRIQLGLVLMQQEQLQQAANLFIQATELKPDLPISYYYLGQVQYQAQDVISAQRSWQQALALLQPNTEDYDSITQLLEKIEPEVEQAKAALEQQQQQQTEGFEGEEATLQENAASPLGQHIPSLTDQNIESRENVVSQPGTAPLNIDQPQLEEIEESSDLPTTLPNDEAVKPEENPNN